LQGNKARLLQARLARLLHLTQSRHETRMCDRSS
jgi:hypothetical protein